MGRVDTKDAYLDTDELERSRGITIFSKQAGFSWRDVQVTLIDTPGHVDFSAEMERVLQVLDCAILVISGPDGVQGHTRTLWRLLNKYQIPTFLFINKMDQPGTEKDKRMAELKDRLNDGCVDFTDTDAIEFHENVATCDESALEQYLQKGRVEGEMISRMIAERKLFPCYFGAAIKAEGVESLLDGLAKYTLAPSYPDEFGARIFKVSRDEQGNRLTHMKVTGGSLKVKDLLTNARVDTEEQIWEEKVNQIRVYSGDKYESLAQVSAGRICAVTGLTKTYPGQTLGTEKETVSPTLEPVLTCKLCFPEGFDATVMLPKIRQLEEEQPELHIIWDGQLKEIQAQIMGEVQKEILRDLIIKRFGVDVTFGPANIVYKETIADSVEGVGHFEPLRHYAEVHLLMEPLPAGSGLEFDTDCSEDMLDKNWQRLILTHLREREHRGVLTGSAITDMRITLIAGKAHLKHTEGGDFRQATYRAVRQGLMEAESILLEPYYNFRLEVPESMVGRAMTDIERMNGAFEAPFKEGESDVLIGYAPVAAMQNYQKEVAAYSKGFGHVFFTMRGYEPCQNAAEVIAAIGYEAQKDLDNPPDSVFCDHGAGYVVPWNQVKEHMHVESPLASETADGEDMTVPEYSGGQEQWIGSDEVDAIIEKAVNANSREKFVKSRGWKRKQIESVAPVSKTYSPQVLKEEYLLVDGYNVIYSWDELNQLAKENMDGAKGRLLDELCNYQAIRKCELIVVFDAYRIAGHPTEYMDYHNIHVVYTKEAETADQYIEKFAHSNASKYRVTVATSDGLEQIIIRGEGCRLLSAKELKVEMEQANRNLRADFMENKAEKKHRPLGEAIENAYDEMRRKSEGQNNQDNRGNGVDGK